jgi:hypothetical protein
MHVYIACIMILSVSSCHALPTQSKYATYACMSQLKKPNIFSSIIREDKYPHPHGSQKVAIDTWQTENGEWPLCLRKKNVGVSEMLDGSLKPCLFGGMSISESRSDWGGFDIDDRSLAATLPV